MFRPKEYDRWPKLLIRGSSRLSSTWIEVIFRGKFSYNALFLSAMAVRRPAGPPPTMHTFNPIPFLDQQSNTSTVSNQCHIAFVICHYCLRDDKNSLGQGIDMSSFISAWKSWMATQKLRPVASLLITRIYRMFTHISLGSGFSSIFNDEVIFQLFSRSFLTTRESAHFCVHQVGWIGNFLNSYASCGRKQKCSICDCNVGRIIGRRPIRSVSAHAPAIFSLLRSRWRRFLGLWGIWWPRRGKRIVISQRIRASWFHAEFGM